MLRGIKDTYKKSEADVIVQNLLQLRIDEGSFYDDAAKSANFLIKPVWEKSPEYYDGKRGQRPHKLSFAASAFANAIAVLPEGSRNTLVFMACLEQLMQEVEANHNFYPFNSLDQL